MSLRAETERLRRELARLASRADSELISRYALWHPPGQRRTLYRRIRRALGRFLRRTGLRPTQTEEPWLPGLKHAEAGDGTGAVVIWAVGTNLEELRDACAGFQGLLAAMPDRSPVLITDVADFAYFSSLGWLVEYVPTLSEPASNYRERKQCYLAWRYRDAPALPVSLGLHQDVQIEELLVD
jgi:hypothetical protein